MQPAPDSSWAGATRRRRLAALALLVTLAHLWVAEHGLPARLGDGAADAPPRRIEVAFVRELQPAAPARAAAVPSPRPAPRVLSRPAAAEPAASAALPAPPEPEAALPLDLAAVPPVPLPPLPAPESVGPLPPAPETAPVQTAATPGATAAADAEPAPIWPPSTRLRYTLTGHYRGPVHGQAQVEWLRAGTRYQVIMELAIGPSFAPMMSRRVSSEGEITAQGLQPRRYDESTQLAFGRTRSLSILFDADQVRLPAGAAVGRPLGVQDSASQFVQLTWLFATQPELLQPGRTVVVPLALPRVVEPWVYEVLDIETLQTPAGPVPAVHVKPQRPPRPGRDLVAEIWVAPSLQYLPVRILIRQDAETHVDLLIDQLPMQAAPQPITPR